MTNTKYKAIVINLLNLIAMFLMLSGYILIIVPAKNYLHAYLAVLPIPVALFLAVMSALFCLVTVIASFLKRNFDMVAIIALMFSLSLLWFGRTVVYPWARYTTHFPTPAGVCWRENALFQVKGDLTGFVRKHHGIIPINDNWKELLIEKGYNFNDTLETWERSYDSSIVINDNIKGMKLEEFDEPVVLLFEGPKGLSFGNEETFQQFVENNKYIYVVLTNGASGRIRLKDGKAESLFGGLNSRDLPLVWE